MLNDVALTLDIDWAPDFMIDAVAELLCSRGVRATWFVTHASPAVDRLRERPDLFELGIHPNFLAGSSHGATPSEVLRHCMALVPEAISTRSHGLVQSSSLLARMVAETPLQIDATMYLPYASHLHPVEYQRAERTIWRVPFFWEDDDEVERQAPNYAAAPLISVPGLKVFNFHPVHLFLNSWSLEPYETLKSRERRLQDVLHSEVKDLVLSGPGPYTLFGELVDHLAQRKTTLRLRDATPLASSVSSLAS